MNVQTEELLVRQFEADNAIDIGHYDHLFLQRVYGDELQKYIKRLKAIGFTGARRVLDTGCGFGQRTLSLVSLTVRLRVATSRLCGFAFKDDSLLICHF